MAYCDPSQTAASIEYYALKLGRSLVVRLADGGAASADAFDREVRLHRAKLKAHWFKAVRDNPPFTLSEENCLAALEQHETKVSSKLSAHIVLVMKATRLCNLRCRYCNVWAEGPDQVMSFENLAQTVKQALSSPDVRKLDFVWHGGEITLLKPKFFRKLVALQERFRRSDQIVTNAVQTNGTRLNDEWLGLLAALQIPVGISLDGPPDINDARRPMSLGAGSTALVLDGLQSLRDAGITHGVLMVIDAETAARPISELLDFLVDNDVRDVDFLNYVPSNADISTGRVDPQFLSFPDFALWMVEVYRQWHHEYRDAVAIRFLDDIISTVTGLRTSRNCYFSGNCESRIFTVDADGSVAPCDKFIGGPASRFGNVADAGAATAFAAYNGLRDYIGQTAEMSAVETCRWFGICKGGCPHDRIAALRLAPDSETACCGMSALLDEIARTECGDRSLGTSRNDARLHLAGSK